MKERKSAMGKAKRDLGVDQYGVKKVMRKRDYLGDMTGNIGLGLMGNITGQMTYFYTDKVGLSVAMIGVLLLVAKVIDAFTDVIAGNIIDHSKGGNKKYLKWMLWLTIPAAAATILLFTVPKGTAGMVYLLISQVFFSAIVYTFIATPYSALQIVRTKSQMERSSIGTLRSLGSYITGMVMSVLLIPITNMMGGSQSAWIRFAAIVAVVIVIMLLICYFSGRNAEFAEDVNVNEDEDHAVPFKEAITKLFHNKYWVIVLIFNFLSQLQYGVSGASGAYYCKWIFGDDNLVGVLGAMGLIPALLGYILARPMIGKLGVKKTIYACLVIGIGGSIVKCLFPAVFMVNAVAGCVISFANIPIMCLYGVLTGMAVDYNEYLYNERLVAISGGATSFGNKVGGGVSSVIITGSLALAGYTKAMETATTGVKYAIYGFSNFVPLIIFVVMIFLFKKFDIMDKITDIQAEVAARKEKQAEN